MSMPDEARQMTPVEFFGGSGGITYAKGHGFNEVPGPTEAELAAIEVAALIEAAEPSAVAPVDAPATSYELPPEPPEPLRPSPDDPEVRPASTGKGPRTPAKS